MTHLLLLPLLLGDVGLKQSATVIGPVRDLNCGADAGLYCSRNSTLSRGDLTCATATAVEIGCVTPGTQTWAGNKTMTGRLKVAQVDAGWVQAGSQMMEGANLTCNDSSNPYTITAYTPDAVTSATVPGTKFVCGTNVGNSDLCWGWFRYDGTRRMGLTENGDLNFTSHVTDTGAATVAGSSFTTTIGNGGASSGATVGGAGGTYWLIAGRGGASAGAGLGGAGGPMLLEGGVGGASSGTKAGGNGGALSLSSGSAGNGSHGGAASLTCGFGGAASADYPAGTGGSVSFIAGAGGTAATGNVGGDGGSIQLFAGAGGTGTTSVLGGYGGDIDIRAGTSGGGISGGNVEIRSGAGGSATTGHVAHIGGAIDVTGGVGGTGNTAGDGKAGGTVTVSAGAGGPTTYNQSGAGGPLYLYGGAGGALSAAADGGGVGGDVTVDTGASATGACGMTYACGSGSTDQGTIHIGQSRAGTVIIGHNSPDTEVDIYGKWVLNGYGLLATHGTSGLAVEKASTAMTASELAVTFATAFTAAPTCTCTHVNTTNSNPCSIKSGSAPTTTTVTFAVASGGTDVVDWICIGTK